MRISDDRGLSFAGQGVAGVVRPAQARLAETVVLAATALLFILPFVIPVRRAPLPTLDGEMLAAVLLAIGAIGAGASGRGEVRVQWPLPAFLLLLAAVGGLHWLTGRLVYTYSATTLFLALTALAAAYCMGGWLRGQQLGEQALRWISVALVAGALLSVLVQLLQLLDVRGLPSWLYFEMDRASAAQPVGNVGQPNQLASYLALALPAAVYLARTAFPAAVMQVVVAIVAAGVAFTLSRMGVLMLLMVGVWLFVVDRQDRRTAAGFALAIGVGYLAGTFAGPYLLAEESTSSVVGRFLSAAYSDRTVMWTEAARIALSHPWLGTGVGEYAAAQYWVASAGPFAIGTPYAHNAVLQFAAEFGLPVALAFVGVTAWWLLSGARTRWTDRHASTLLMMGTLLLLHGMLEWSLWVLFVSIPAVVLFALAEPRIQHQMTIDPRASLLPVGLAGLLYTPLLHLDYDDVAIVAGRLAAEHRETNRLSFASMMGTMQLGTATYFKPQADRLILIVAPPKPPVGGEDVRMTARVASRLADVPSISLHITTLARAGRVDEAVRHVERLRVFAVTPERYAAAEREILRALEGEGARADALRSGLAALR